MDYFSFLNKYSTGEDYKDKDRYKKVKVTSIDKFDDCLIDLNKSLSEKKEKTPFLFTGPIDGVDARLEALLNLSNLTLCL